MSLTVGILAYNSEQALPGLLASLPDALAGVDDWHLVVVDGASTDGTVNLVRRTAPEATCVDLGGNRGFAAAANAAIAAFPATGAVLILSPRVRLTPGCVKVMLDALHEPGAGIAVPRLFRGPGQPYPSLRRRPTLLRAFAEALLGGRLTRPFGALSELIADPAGYSSGTRADWATGAVTMMSRECVTRAGPWDESFFLYSEETEFELRAADAGFRLAFADVRRGPSGRGVPGAPRAVVAAMREPGPPVRHAPPPRARHLVLGGDAPRRVAPQRARPHPPGRGRQAHPRAAGHRSRPRAARDQALAPQARYAAGNVPLRSGRTVRHAWPRGGIAITAAHRSRLGRIIALLAAFGVVLSLAACSHPAPAQTATVAVSPAAEATTRSPVSPSPTASAKPSPPPLPAYCHTGGAELWANLAACGWPGPPTPGPTCRSARGASSTDDGGSIARTIPVTKPNTVISCESVHGMLDIEAQNVTIENSVVVANSGKTRRGRQRHRRHQGGGRRQRGHRSREDQRRRRGARVHLAPGHQPDRERGELLRLRRRHFQLGRQQLAREAAIIS